MATNTQNITTSATISNAEFQAMCQFISNLLESAGITKTADSGQIDTGTATFPGSNSVAAGYEIREFTDALAGTDPVVMKIEYGRSVGANNFTIWLTFGTGSDGAGNITGEKMARTQMLPMSSTGTFEWNISAGNNWFVIETLAAASSAAIHSVERTKDPDKADNNDGLLVAYKQFNGSMGNRFVDYHNTSPIAETAAICPMSVQQTTGLHSSGDVLAIPFLYYGIGEVKVGANLAGVHNTDFTLNNTYTFNILGSNQTMKISTNTASASANFRNTNGRFAYRFE